jgi:hypothetical protein
MPGRMGAPGLAVEVRRTAVAVRQAAARRWDGVPFDVRRLTCPRYQGHPSNRMRPLMGCADCFTGGDSL